MILELDEATAARRRITFLAMSPVADDSPVTGLSFAAADLQVSKNGAAEGNSAGSVMEVGGGIYYYEATAGEVDTVGALTVRVDKSGVRHYVAMCQVVAYDPYAAYALGSVCTEARLAELDAANMPSDLDSVLTDTADMQPKLGTPAGASISADIATVDSNVDAILVDTAEIGAAGAGLTDLGGMSAGMKAEVNAEALDVINTDTFAEPGQEAPAATASLQTKISYLYKLMRNKVTQTATTLSIFADDASTVDQKATVSDDGTTYTRGELGTGP